jgi:hypothetical protein
VIDFTSKKSPSLFPLAALGYVAENDREQPTTTDSYL